MMALAWEGWLTIGVIGLVLVAMIRSIAGPDLIMMGGLFILAAAGVLTPAETFSGFANPAMATIGALFILSAAMRETGALELTLGRLFGRVRTEQGALVRTLPVLAALSAFLNNAPIVAMMAPLVIDWSRRVRIAPSRLLMSLSHSTMLGSVTTIIGTSVTLAVAGLVVQAGLPPLRLFEFAPVGLPIAGVGLLYLFFVAPRLLPDRADPVLEVGDHLREYTVAMQVEPGCALIGRGLEEAGLRHLPGLFLFEIQRRGRVHTPVAPDEILEAGDRLFFAGAVNTIVDLQRIRGLVPVAEDDQPRVMDPRHQLIEAVVSRSSPLVNRSVRASNFRTVYDAAIIAVHRNGERVPGKIGEIVLRPGDTLLLQASATFVATHGNSADFNLISEIPESSVPRHDRAGLAIGVFVLMIVLAATGVMPISIGSFVAAGVLIATRCITGPVARKSVQIHVLVVIAAGFGIAKAIDKTGAAVAIGHVVVAQASVFGPIGVLATIYLLTMVLSEMLHHAASAALMFPIALAVAAETGVDAMPFVAAVALAATCAFANPMTYQTHLLVYGPGGYRFKDFVRVGLPLDFVCAAIALVLIPRVWPL